MYRFALFLVLLFWSFFCYQPPAEAQTLPFQNQIGSPVAEEIWDGLYDDQTQLFVSVGSADILANIADIWISQHAPNGVLVSSHRIQFMPGMAPGYFAARDMCKAPDDPASGKSTYYITGIHIGQNANPDGTPGNGQKFVARVDGNGQVLWFRLGFSQFGPSVVSEGIAVDLMPNGDVIAVGNANDAQGWQNVVATRFDPMGNLIWSNFYERRTAPYVAREACANAFGQSCGQAPDAGVIVVGEVRGEPLLGQYGMLERSFAMQIDGNGNECWRRAYPSGLPNSPIAGNGGFQSDAAYDIVPSGTAVGQYTVVGRADFSTGPNLPAGGSGIYTFQINPMGFWLCGNVYREQNAAGALGSSLFARTVTKSFNSGNIIVAGPRLNSNDVFVAELSTSCNAPAPIWANHYNNWGTDALNTPLPGIMFGGVPESICLANTQTPTYFVTSNTDPGTHGMRDGHLLNTDLMGQVPGSNCEGEPISLLPTFAGENFDVPGLPKPLLLWSPRDLVHQPYPVFDLICGQQQQPCDVSAGFVYSFDPCTHSIFATSTSTGNGTLGFNWSTGSTAATASVVVPTGLPIFTICLYVTNTMPDGTVCMDTFCQNIPIPQLGPLSLALVAQSTCNQTWLFANAVNGTPAYSYLWSDGSTTSSITTTMPGVYCVTVTDANGCTQSACITVTASSLFGVAISQSGGCGSSLLTATPAGGMPVFTYSWSNGDTNQNTVATVPGVYCVTVTDAAGCTASSCFTYVPNNPMSVNLTYTSNCTVAIVNAAVAGGTPGYTFAWSNGAIGPVMTTATSGTYCVTVTDAAGCTASACITVVISSPLSVVIAVGSGCGSGILTANPLGGTAPFSYNWSNGNTTQTTTVTTSGTYCVTVTDANGCTADICTNVNVAPALTVSIQQVANCSTAVLSTLVTGGTPGFSYAWSDGSTTPSITVSTSGTYCVTVTDANGCTAVDCQNVFVASPLAVVLLQSGGCSTATIGASVSGGNPAYSFNWSNGSVAPNITVATSGTYCVTVTDARGCTASACATVTVAPISVAILPSALICGGANLATTVTGTAPFTYAWSNGAIGSSTNVSTNGTYCVTVTDANGCTATACHTITWIKPFTVSITSSQSCTGTLLNALPLNGVAPYTFAWSDGSITNPTTVTASGTYCVTVTDANGCTTSACLPVTVAPPLTVNFTHALASPTNCLRLNFFSTVTGGLSPYTYSWSFAGAVPATSTAANPAGITYPAPGTYTVCVTVTDARGCTATLCRPIQVGQPCNLNTVDFCTTVEPSGTTGFKVTVSNVTHNCNGTATIQYSFNGGATWGTTPTFTTTTPGVISVCVRVTCTVCGQTCTRTCCKSVQINAPCNIPSSATLTVTVNQLTGVATLTASILSPAAAGYDWDFNGDGIVDASTVSNTATYLYAVGTHTACVTIRRSANCSKTICRTVVMEPICNVSANFTARHCTNAPLSVSFTGLLTNATSVLWNFGDGNTSTAFNPTHTYANYGTYTVCLTAYKNPQCFVRVCYLVIVGPKNCGGVVLPPANHVTNDDGTEEAEEAYNEMVETDGTGQNVQTAPTIDGLSLFPNPANERTNLVFELNEGQEVQITVSDMNGRTIESFQTGAANGQNVVAIPTDRLGQGLYLVRLNAGGTIRTTKLMINR